MRKFLKKAAGAAIVGVALLFGLPAQGQAAAGSALRFNGGFEFVSIPHHVAYNAYPFTASAWFRTTNLNSNPEAIVSKYFAADLHGFSVHLVNGSVRAWFFRNSSGNWVWNQFGDGQGVDGGFVADGRWHHVAFAVDGAGGRLFVDGVLKQNLGWSGTPGAPTTVAPLHFGAIANFGTFFKGDIDEVSLWDYALTNNSINYIKFRRLNGNEAGLISYWRLNEGSGTTVTETTPSARAGNLIGGLQWIASTAPIALSPVAGTGIFFDGVDDQVTVNHTAALNAYPLTVTAWFRTSRVSGNYDAIVNKYQGGSGNGYSLHVQNGRLAAFYFNPVGGRVYTADPGFDGGFVADGQWHHVALTVDASGGKLYLDGVQTGSQGWVGSPGPPTDTTFVSFGCYPSEERCFSGQIDEVAIWNRTFTPAEIVAMHNLRLTGSEPNLVGYWPMNEGSGNLAGDFTGNGRTATLQPTGAFWIGSLARLGDGSTHFLPTLDQAVYGRLWANQASSNRFFFPINYVGSLRRFHDFGPAPAPLQLEIMNQAMLRDAGAQLVPLKSPSVQSSPWNLLSENANAPATNSYVPREGFVSIDPVQLDSVNGSFSASMTLSHFINGGPTVTNAPLNLPLTRLLHFNGRLVFGDVATTFTDIANAPAITGLFPPSHLQTQLLLPPGGVHIAGRPTFNFGGGPAFNAHLGPDGTATNVSGAFFFIPPAPLETSGIRYWLGSIGLSSSGATADGIFLYFPTGFGFRFRSADTRVFKGHFDAYLANAKLDAALKPTSNIVFAAAQYGDSAFYFSEETKPFWIVAPRFEWRVAEGRLQIAEAASLGFVRQTEDDDVAATRPSLANPLAADRISNDGYYSSIARVAGEPVSIRPDTNGSALLTMRAALQPTQFRPHFPYMNRNVGGHINDGGGQLLIADDLINVTASFLVVNGPIPVPYGRDCGPEQDCGGFPTVGHQILNFSPQSSQLSFTPDGGFIAHGSIPPTNLTWGYIGGTNYAQRTSNVETGAYHIPGTFLRGDQTTVADAHRPAVLLLTGRGTETNSPYIERPDTASYADGFANYAGLNFRQPISGRSVIAGQDTGPYPLTPRAKYYARYGGVSGIHESVDFRRNLTLSGYPFSFRSYRLSYLDSDHWESRTDGSLSLPYPSGFPVEFERMKFHCRGSLDLAQLPASVGTKHMDYWNTDIKPLSIQFKPPLADPCSLSNRFLVLGVEAKLPFIPQALHAALGFKTNGNLVTLADAVQGVDSRFSVTPNLELPGPGGGKYPLTIAADGYFNNWETANRPETGFYNLFGRLRVPFFRDVKVHLHVTPTSPTTAQLNLMGGWPAEQGLGENRGWRMGAQDPFRTPEFDPSHRGWPASVSLEAYHRSPTEDFRARAQRDWIEVARFDYPLEWDPFRRTFAGFVDKEVILPVIDVNSRLKELSPGKVDCNFSQDINLELPRIKMLDLANDAIHELNAPVMTLSNAIVAALRENLNTAGLTVGFRSLQRVLRENADSFFRPVLEDALDPVVDQLYPILSNTLSSGKSILLNNVSSIVSAGTNNLATVITSLNGTGQVKRVFGEVNQVLTDVDATLGLFLRVLEKKSENGKENRHVVREIVKKLVEDQGPALQFFVALQDEVVNSLLAEIEPTLAEIESELRTLRTEFNQLRIQVAAATGDFAAALNAAGRDADALQRYLSEASNAVSNLLHTVIGPMEDFFKADVQSAKRQIRERLIIAFLSSPFQGKYQQTFRSFLTDPNFLLNQLTDVLFDQINRQIRNGLAANIQGAEDGIFQKMKGGGLISESLLAARIRGAPTFEGDSLRKIHLDAEINLRLPDDMKFTAYLDIKELNSQSTPISCIPSGDAAAEVTLGTKDAPLNWAGVKAGDDKKLNLSLEARWTLQGGAVRGIGGSLGISGNPEFKGCSMGELGATLAIGPTENYFAAKAKATVLIFKVPVKFQAGIFGGHACSIDALKFVDPQVQEVLPAPGEFRGVYLEYGGGLSLAEILFPDIEPRCALDIRARITTALYYKDGPRFGAICGRQKVGVDVDLFCLLHGGAEWAVFACADSAGQLVVGGSGKVCGSIGICPLCEEACKTIVIKGVINDGGIDYFVDY